MRFLRAAGLLFVLVVTSGCSSQATLHQLSELPAHARFADRYQVVNPPRFRLSPTSSLSIATSHKVPQAWLVAGNRGLQDVFNRADKDGYQLLVDWPEFSEPSNVKVHTAFKAGIFGVLEMPKIPAQTTLKLKLLDHSGASVANMTLKISPQWWGSTWSDPEMLAASFSHLADVLVGR